MRQVKGGFYPAQLIHDALGPAKIQFLNRNCNLALFSHVPALMANYDSVLAAYRSYEHTLPLRVDSRYSSAFYAVFTLMEYLGVDWKAFFHDWVQANEDGITRSTGIRESDSILRDMLYATVIHQSDRDNNVCVAMLLANADTREDINTSSVGMYYDRSTDLLLILITQAIRLINRPGRAPMSVSRLKDILDRHSSALTTKEVVASGILNKVDRFLGIGVRVHDVVVLRTSEVLGQSTPVPTSASVTYTVKTPAAATDAVAEAPAGPPQAAKEATNDARNNDPGFYKFETYD